MCLGNDILETRITAYISTKRNLLRIIAEDIGISEVLELAKIPINTLSEPQQ